MKFYAHSDKEKDKSEWHLLKTHLEDTAKLAAGFAASFGAEELAFYSGLLHDIGKYSAEFQQRLNGAQIKVDHSTAGAQVANEKYGEGVGTLLAYVVAGHHSGLPDWGSTGDSSSLEARLKRDDLPDYSAFNNEIEIIKNLAITKQLKPNHYTPFFTYQFFIRILYSCLVDADFLDTERNLNIEKSLLRRYESDWADMKVNIDKYLFDLAQNAKPSRVNKIRSEVLQQCIAGAELPRGLFTLTVPTGGGKTLSSAAFAVNHAVSLGMKKIIYVVPYTTIIEQNAGVFRKIFGDEAVLEHHSNFDFYKSKNAEEETEFSTDVGAKLKLACENWDVPIIVTTNVQFLESFYAARSSRCRKLHNIADSVIIIDEAQMIPTPFLHPCLAIITELINNYNCSIVLCTATQPALGRFLPPELMPNELMENPEELYQSLRRVKIENQSKNILDDDELIKEILSAPQVLCIVNTKKHARIVFKGIKAKGNSFHLSTRMCPAHRSKVIADIRQKLKNSEECRVVSTQLIEAGVDIDFPLVLRSSAGIDSVAQSAGRCNREGTMEAGRVILFRPEKHGIPAGYLSRTASVGEMVASKYKDPLSLEAVKEYFSQLYFYEGEGLDEKKILWEMKQRKNHFRFRDMAEAFKLIDDDTVPVIIPWNHEAAVLIDEARESLFPRKYLRSLQKYCVQVYPNEAVEMADMGMLEVISERILAVRPVSMEKVYDDKVGLLPVTPEMIVKDVLII